VSDKPKVDGYLWHQKVNEIRQASNIANRALMRIVDERPAPAVISMYLLSISTQLGQILDAVGELERISRNG
jgi:hypothetical protein